MADPIVQVAVQGEREMEVSLPLSKAKDLCIFSVGGLCNTTHASECNLTEKGCRGGWPVIHPDNIPQE